MSNALHAGVDEAGRGPLVGSVVAAAVILDPLRPIAGLNDSKKLSAARREALFEVIMRDATSVAVAEATHTEIDELNILHASMLAMQRAVLALSVRPTKVLCDGNRCPQLDIPSEAIVRGDATVASISAASIIAKVSRDRMMHELHERHPQYGFDQHKGYPTVAHRKALAEFGPIEAHRISFAPVKAASRETSHR